MLGKSTELLGRKYHILVVTELVEKLLNRAIPWFVGLASSVLVQRERVPPHKLEKLSKAREVRASLLRLLPPELPQEEV